MDDNRVKVTFLSSGEPSGLAMILSQYFEQNIRDFRRKSEQAAKIVGKLVIEAAEGGVAVTVNFKGNEIELADGHDDDAMIFVRGGIFSITELATGGAGALTKFGSRDLRVCSAWKHPIFALRVARFMKLPKEMRLERKAQTHSAGWRLAVAAAGAAATAGLAAYLLLR